MHLIEIPLGLKILLAVVVFIGAGFYADRQTSLVLCDQMGLAIDPVNGHLVDCPRHYDEPFSTDLIIPGELPNDEEIPEETAIALSTR